MRCQGAPHAGEGTVPDRVQDQVVSLLLVREVLRRVVDNLVGAYRPDHLHVPRAAHADHVSAQRLGHLHREGAHASGSTVHQHALAWLQLPVVAQRLKGRLAGKRDRGCFSEAEALRLGHQILLAAADVLGERPPAPSEHLVAGLHAGHVGPDPLHHAGYVHAGNGPLGSGEPRHRAHEEGLPSHGQPVQGVDRRGEDPHEDAVGAHHRHVDLLQPQDLWWPVLATYDGLH
jgi:hypothetical protein